jgi:hypothetical protein
MKADLVAQNRGWAWRPNALKIRQVPIVVCTRSVLWFSGAFASGLITSAVVIHAIGYRLLPSPALKGTATRARDSWEQFPEHRGPAIRKALEKRRRQPALHTPQQDSGSGDVGRN